jgi:hypothetical protein
MQSPGLGQSPVTPDTRQPKQPVDQRSEMEVVERTSNDTRQSSFKISVMDMMVRISQRLDDLTARVGQSSDDSERLQTN